MIELKALGNDAIPLSVNSSDAVALRSTTPPVDGVISVNGKQGVVTLTAEDIGATGVPTNVRQAIYTLLNSGAYATTGLTDEIAIVESWAEQVTSLSISPTTLSLSNNTPQTITATVVPSGSTVTWSSSDTDVATVVGGVVTGVSNGTCTITASSGDKSATCSVTVTGFATLESISAVYTQSGTVYDTDSLDSLRDDLVVTATYSDSTTATVTDYTLSGTLTVGTSTITVAYGGKTTTFSVTVTQGTLYPMPNGTHSFSATNYGDVSVTNHNHVEVNNPYNSYGHYSIFDDVSTNGSKADVSNINSPSTPIFTLPAGAEVVLEITNISKTGNTSDKFAIALRSGSTSVISTGDLTTATFKTVTQTITNATNITCAFVYTYVSITHIEFDVSLTVNGVQWI